MAWNTQYHRATSYSKICYMDSSNINWLKMHAQAAIFQSGWPSYCQDWQEVELPKTLWGHCTICWAFFVLAHLLSWSLLIKIFPSNAFPLMTGGNLCPLHDDNDEVKRNLWRIPSPEMLVYMSELRWTQHTLKWWLSLASMFTQWYTNKVPSS